MYNKVKTKDEERKENNRLRLIYRISYIVVILLLTIAYGYLAISLDKKITAVSPGIDIKPKPKPEPEPEPVPVVKPKPAPTKIEAANWNIEFDNLKVNDGSIESPKPELTNTTVTYEVSLAIPGEYYSFDVDVVNRGSIDAKIYDIFKTKLTEEQDRYLDYVVTYKDGSEIKENDTLLKHERKTLTVKVEFSYDIEKEDLPQEEENLKLVYRIDYVEK